MRGWGLGGEGWGLRVGGGGEDRGPLSRGEGAGTGWKAESVMRGGALSRWRGQLRAGAGQRRVLRG